MPTLGGGVWSPASFRVICVLSCLIQRVVSVCACACVPDVRLDVSLSHAKQTGQGQRTYGEMYQCHASKEKKPKPKL